MTSSVFNYNGFRDLVHNHWRHHGHCNHLNWAVVESDNGVCQIGIAPVFQEVYGGDADGKKVWTGFEFDLAAFLSEPGIELEELGTMSYCIDRNSTPFVAVTGLYDGVSFAMRLHLEPIPETDPQEIIDTIRGEIRAINDAVNE